MRFIDRTFRHPSLQNLLLRGGKFFVGIRRRHQIIFVCREDAFDQFAFLRLAGNERLLFDGHVAQIEAQFRLAGVLSEPWQRKQLSERIGRTSRLKLSGAAAGSEIAEPTRTIVIRYRRIWKVRRCIRRVYSASVELDKW